MRKREMRRRIANLELIDDLNQIIIKGNRDIERHRLDHDMRIALAVRDDKPLTIAGVRYVPEVTTKRIVWKLEQTADHQAGFVRAIYTTKELAKAAAPSVQEWAPSGDDGTEYEVTRRPFDDAWEISPVWLDPDWSDLKHTASLLCETDHHSECERCPCGCHPPSER